MATAFQSNAFQNNAFQISGGSVVVPPVTPTILPGGVGGRGSWRRNYASTFEFYRKKLKREQETEYRDELLQLADVAERLSQQQAVRAESVNSASRLDEHFGRFQRQVEQFIQDTSARDAERRLTLARIIRESEEAARIEAELQDDEQAAVILLLH